MANTLKGANDAEKLNDLCSKNFKEQCIWFLNSFWEEFGQKDAQKLWTYKHQMDELDLVNRTEGSSIDEFQAHRFFEKNNETMTVQEMRDGLRKSGAITASFKVVPFTHILIAKYKVDWKTLVNAPQGSKEEVIKAEKLLNEVSAAFEAANASAIAAAAALKEAQSAEADAKKTAEEATRRDNEARAREEEALAREANARQQEAPFKAAQEEVDKALADVKSQEETRDKKTQDLTQKSSEGGVVAQNKAKAELAQHLAEDPLPLRKAKITLEAALKKAEKARAPFEAATKEAEAARAIASEAAQQASKARAAAEKARIEAEKLRERSEEAARAADRAVDEARKRLEEAEAYLNEVKARMPHGRAWWMEKEIEEKRKYLPTRKGGITK